MFIGGVCGQPPAGVLHAHSADQEATPVVMRSAGGSIHFLDALADMQAQESGAATCVLGSQEGLGGDLIRRIDRQSDRVGGAVDSVGCAPQQMGRLEPTPLYTALHTAEAILLLPC
jgi:hypothetical protein